MKPTELSFKTLCDFFDAVAKATPKRKILFLRRLLEKNLERNSDELFEVFRLILPYRDNERGNFELKEPKLASMLIKACSLDPKVNSAAQRAIEWKKPPTKHAGNFPMVMEEYLLRTNCGKSAGTDGEKILKIGELNHKLDELVAASGNAKATTLAWLIRNTSPRLMKWIICIILKDLKIGMSENTILKEYHEDGIKLFNKTMNMRQVINELRDPSHRILNEDVEPGQPVRAQLAATMNGVKQIFQKVKGKAFVVETKFDGERMQIHHKGDMFFYYSRNGLDHGEQSGYTIFNRVLEKQVQGHDYILDWLKSAFNLANQIKDANTRLEMTDVYKRSSVVEHDPEYEAPSLQDIEIICVAFDVLHNGKESVIHLSLLERHKILSNMLADPPAEGVQLGRSSVFGRAFALVPYRQFLNGMPVSKVSQSEEDIQEAFDSAVKGQDEGIMIKDLDSKWIANDRKGGWMKLKPDHAFISEIDAVVIGGHFGQGRRAGIISEYLLALAEKPSLGQTTPSSFISMCRVGTGVNDEERKEISDKLEPLFIEASQKRSNHPKCYKVTGHLKERPDVWISDPFQSVVLEVLADVRLITSSVFATQQSLRFPRVQRIRWDKGAADVQTHDDFLEQAEARRVKGEGKFHNGKKKKPVKKKEAKTQLGLAAAAYSPVDVSKTQLKSDILRGAKMEVLSFGKGPKSKDNISKLIKELGGQMYMNMTPSVTHFLSESATHYQVGIRIKKNYDVLTLDWLLDVAEQGRLVTPSPHHYIYMTKESRDHNPAVDRFGDPYAIDCSIEDIHALLDRHIALNDADPKLYAPPNRAGAYTQVDAVVDTEKELAELGYPLPMNSLFRGCKCCFYTEAGDAGNANSMQVMQAENLRMTVRLCGGSISDRYEGDTTHTIIQDQVQGAADPRRLMQFINATVGIAGLEELLEHQKSNRLKIVSPSWVIDSFRNTESQIRRGEHLQRESEDAHLHSLVSIRSSDWPWEEFGVTTKVKKQEVAPPDNAPKRRRGRPAVSKPVPRRTKQRKVKQGTFKLDPSKNEERELEKEEGDENGDKSQADVASDQEVSGRSSRSRQRSKKPPRPEDLPTALEEEEEIPKHKRVRPRGKTVVSSDSDVSMSQGDTKVQGEQEPMGNSETRNASKSTTPLTASNRLLLGKELKPEKAKAKVGRWPISRLLAAQMSSSDEDDAAGDRPGTGELMDNAGLTNEARASDSTLPSQLVSKTNEDEAVEADVTGQVLAAIEPRTDCATATGKEGRAARVEEPPVQTESNQLRSTTSSQLPALGKKMTLKERMALRGIGAKKP